MDSARCSQVLFFEVIFKIYCSFYRVYRAIVERNHVLSVNYSTKFLIKIISNSTQETDLISQGAELNVLRVE